jgi:oligosaccharide reducing-end xylanase
VYRNLFAERGLADADIQAKVNRAYHQLFHGASQDEAVMVSAGQNAQGPLAYVLDVGNGDIRSEGMSYGMMIAVQMDQKQDFDALWNWAKTFMYIADASHPVHGYFAWQMRADGTAIDEMPAPDGEEYFATALLFAAHRWGNGAGVYDYGAEAQRLLTDLRHRKPINGIVNGSRTTTAVALFNPKHKMVRFTPDTGNFETNGDHTDPSYHLPAFYEAWALWGPPADREFWGQAAQASRDHFVCTTHPQTALSPDFSKFDGAPKAASWDKNTVNFRYDAWRTAMNWAMDFAWWSKDPRQVELSNRLLDFFAGQGEAYASNYQLDGTPTNQDHALGLVSTNATAALAATTPNAWRFVDALYSAAPDGQMALLQWDAVHAVAAARERQLPRVCARPVGDRPGLALPVY